MLARSDIYFRLHLLLIIIHITCISLSLCRTSAPIHLTSVLDVLGTQETSCILIAGLLERDTFDHFLPEFDKPWVIHLRETCCCSTNLCTWRPNTVYKNRSVRRHHISPALGVTACYAAIMGSDSSVVGALADPSVVEFGRTSFIVARRQMVVWGPACPHQRIKMVVLGSLSRYDEDLLDACLHWSGRSFKFRKAPPANSKWTTCLKIARSDRFRSCATVFFPTVWFQRERYEALYTIAIMGHVLVPWWCQSRRMAWKPRSED
jgi:hypothetical protein